VILLKNSNERNLSLAKEGSSKKERKKKREKMEERKKKGARIEKKKRWNLIWRSSIFQKEKKEHEIYKLLGEILSKERKKGDHIFL
jgi:hypothetical protein